MKIITNLLLLIFLGISTVSFAQKCGTPSDTQNQDFSSSSLRKEGIEVNTTFTINIYFHIVRNTNGTNAFTPTNTDAIVRKIKKSIKNLEFMKKEAIPL